jgi:Mannosyltransferase (PIG-V)
MDTSSEVAVEPGLGLTAPPPAAPQPAERTTWRDRYEHYRPAILTYAATRVLLILVAIIDGWIHTRSFTHEIGNWDGYWYQMLANHGYPNHVIHGQSTLGFFPLYPMLMAALTPLTAGSAASAGLLISTVGGLIAAILVQEIATDWWDEAAGRRAAVLFCLFPGSVVFSMVYTEGILIPLAVGSLLALQRRRWLLAGVLAGFATAANVTAVPLALALALGALRAIRQSTNAGKPLIDRQTLKPLLAPILSVTGIAAFAIYLWRHAGSPTASLTAQRTGWHEKTDVFAVVHLVTRLASQIDHHHPLNLNYVVGLVGVFVLVGGLILLCKRHGRVPIEVILFTLGVIYLTVTSEYVPPNPRLLITAFPLVIVYARYITGRRFKWLCVVMTLLLIELSGLTFVGVTLRP